MGRRVVTVEDPVQVDQHFILVLYNSEGDGLFLPENAIFTPQMYAHPVSTLNNRSS